jgi:hypothetical protein
MTTKEAISKEIKALYDEGLKIAQTFASKDKEQNFQFDYQRWYTKALRVVELLAPDRHSEFKSYYEINPKRKSLGYGTYVIQDFMKNVVPGGYQFQDFDSHAQAALCFVNQLSIFQSLSQRVGTVLSNIDGQLLSELHDAELHTAKGLLKVSVRAAGSLTGVVIEHHLQKLAIKHGVEFKKKNPTIGDLNEPLKNAGVFDTPTWRKVAYLADIRNLCSHKKDIEPTKEQVDELINGANWLIKNVF